MSNTDRQNQLRGELQDILGEAAVLAECLCAEMSHDDYTAVSKAKYGILDAREALKARWGESHE